MNKTNEINIFLKRLSDLYRNNPNLQINSDTIYHQLRQFRNNNNNYEKIEPENIEYIQKKLDNKYKTNNKIEVWETGYFWIFQNRAHIKDNDTFNTSLYNSIKIYVAVDIDNIEYVAGQIFDFIIENNIITQSKISKEFRNDALVLRVATIEDAKKLSDFINNKLQYTSKTYPNPFLYNQGKISLAADGDVSFNCTVSEILAKYIENRRNKKLLDTINYDDFVTFLNNEYLQTIGYSESDYVIALKKLKTSPYVESFYYKIGVYHILKSNLNGNIKSIDDFKEMQNVSMLEKVFGKKNEQNNPVQTEISQKTTINEFNCLSNYYHLIQMMSNYYDLEEIHLRFESYINTGDISYFTRRLANGESIRGFVAKNFTSALLNHTMKNALWIRLIQALKNTYIKYNYEQIRYAMEELLQNNNYSAFTNDGEARDNLIKSGSIATLKTVIREHVIKHGYEYNFDNLMIYLFNQINNNENNKKLQ